MRILHVSHNHHIVGGSDRVFFETTRILENAGHEVVPFCLASEKNIPSRWSAYFPNGADTADPKFRDSLRYFVNLDARKKLSQLIRDTGPFDLAHFHIYHGKQTPAILPILRRYGIPVVQTLHEYKLVCPVYTLQRNNQNCELCISGSLSNCVRHRCKDGSTLKSAIMATEAFTSRLMGDVRHVSRFICVSDFQRRLMERSGISARKLVTLHNFVETRPGKQADTARGYLLYFGRIETLKGLPTLISAVKQTNQKLVIAGNGNWLPEMTREIQGHPNIRYVGFKAGTELDELVQNASAIVVPSEWYENCPMSVLEAKAVGKPIIGARIGGIPELVRDGIDGFLFNPGDVDDLVLALQSLQDCDQNRLYRANRKHIETEFSARKHLKSLESIYQTVVADFQDKNDRVPA